MQQFINYINELLLQLSFPAAMDAAIKEQKEQAVVYFKENSFPAQNIERWRNSNYSRMLTGDFILSVPETIPASKDLKSQFSLHAKQLTLLNGFYSGSQKLEKLPNGVILGSFAEASVQYPELVSRYYGKCLNDRVSGFQALNTALATDGFFIFVPKNVQMEQPVQILNMILAKHNYFIQTRNLVILEENSSLKLIHCDDSYNQEKSFSNQLTEIYVHQNSSLEHYKTQNLNDLSGLYSFTYTKLEQNSNLQSNTITFNGGMVRNQSDVMLNGENCDAHVYGLSLMDNEQQCENHVLVDHAKPNSTSKELFKSVLDGHANGVFNGHILVREHAAGTKAYQSNKNLLLNNKATIVSKPFLEIYNDDVKCSHGATTGQLDTNALFYLRSRGIGERTAKMLLMVAFCDEIMGQVSIEQLRNRLISIVKKRLNGDLNPCEQCSLYCSTLECSIDHDADNEIVD